MNRFLTLALVFGLAPLAAIASDGQASGTIDGRTVDIALDCSDWQDGSTATARAADGSAFEAARLSYNDSLAVTWGTDGKTYQLMFGDVAFAPSLTTASSFRNPATGDSYDAEISIDCNS